MNDQTLSYLKCLRASFSKLSTQPLDESAAMHVVVSGRLLDFMIVQRTLLPEFQQEFHAGLRKLLPDIRAAVPGLESVCKGLDEIAAAGDPDAFARFLQLGQELQAGLLSAGTDQALALCKAVVRLESEYNRHFEHAVAERPAADPAPVAEASAARNVRAFDEGKLLDFLRRSFPGESGLGIAQCHFVSGGYSKLTLAIALVGVKDLPQEIILRSDTSTIYSGASVTAEYGIIKVLHENGICVPRPLGLEASGEVFGAPFMLVEKRPGSVIGHMLNLPQPNRSVCHDVAAQLAAIHRIPLADLAPCFNTLDTRNSDKILALIDEDAAAWRALDMPSPVYETAFDWLRRNAGLNDKAPRTLIHGDYGLQNILIANDKVSVVLDWEFARIGNPAYDVGFFYDQAESLSSWEDFLQAYADAGAPVPDRDQLDYNILLAATRLGVITARMRKSFVSGADIGIGVAWMVSENHYEIFVGRIASALDRVL